MSRQAADPIEGLKTCSLKQVNGAVKEVVGKVVGDSKLEAGGKADKAEGKVRYWRLERRCTGRREEVVDSEAVSEWYFYV